MLIGARIRQVRILKGMSQGDIEAATGLLRCYISRVENGHTTPSLETVERFVAALHVPLCELFAEESVPLVANLPSQNELKEQAKKNGKEGAEARFFLKLKPHVGRLSDPDRRLLLVLAKKLAARDRTRVRSKLLPSFPFSGLEKKANVHALSAPGQGTVQTMDSAGGG